MIKRDSQIIAMTFFSRGQGELTLGKKNIINPRAEAALGELVAEKMLNIKQDDKSVIVYEAVKENMGCPINAYDEINLEEDFSIIVGRKPQETKEISGVA